MNKCLWFLTGWLVCSCSILTTRPDHLSIEERFAQLPKGEAPIQEPLQIHWDRYAIPFVEAENDDDLPFGIGLVHAHLRIDQMEIFRRASQGRLSEIGGPIAIVKKIDQLLRIINLQGSAEKSLQVMSPESRRWMERYTEGINWYIRHLKAKPVTSQMFDEDLQPYSVVEVMALARLVTADLSWAVYVKYLSQAHRSGWQAAFQESLKSRQGETSSYENDRVSFNRLIQGFSRSGSNSVVISGQKSATGSALIASDPHVGLILPNFWILTGIKSPSYHAFGMMIPGVPVIGVGRNKDVAWGGTNMRGISSHLYDVSKLGPKGFVKRKEKIRRRWWFTSDFEVRETPFGPILTDAELFEPEVRQNPKALNWIGREGSDEVATFLNAMRAKNWQEFSSAFESYKVSAMNITYADRHGNIGMVAAYSQPVLKEPKATLQFSKEMENPVVRVKKPTEHPNPYNPPSQFIASANNKPFANPEIPMSFSYATSDRVNRIKQLLGPKKKVSLADLKLLQSDVFNQNAVEIVQTLKPYLKKDRQQALSRWDGRFLSHRWEPVAFFALGRELWMHHVMSLQVPEVVQEDLLTRDNWKAELLQVLKKQSPEQLNGQVAKAWKGVEKALIDFPTWGDFTKQRMTTVFGFLPVIGSKFRYPGLPISGAADTLSKFSRSKKIEGSESTYGASSRHVSDLSSQDENYFVLNGGQDSWIFNKNLKDQAALFHSGQYIKIPLSMPEVRKHFSLKTMTYRPTQQ